MPPAVLAGAQASVNHLRNSSLEREKHKSNTRTLLKKLLSANLPVMKSDSHILPLFIGDPVQAKTASDILLDQFNIYVQPINYPTVAKGEERLRISPSPVHTIQMMDDFVDAASQIWKHLGLKMLDDYLRDPAVKDKFFYVKKDSDTINIGKDHLYSKMDSYIL